ncbi:zinc finger protein 189-like [Sitophilus oryzae]|uniref:Zinc finger protein 189-like n=1 Tax=Sitophilus oryzae TaxID=7048 RepID=A0A6J2YN29_SITOR|nr:zinc finger protein 189-like [Sitophilus oryzae]
MIPEDIQFMIDKICRSCMCESDEMQNVFKKSAGSSEEPMLLSDMLMACASVEVAEGDGLPYLLCLTCENKLSTAFEFKQQCERSDSALREIANQDGKSKREENIIVQPDVHEGLFEEDEDDLPLAKRFKQDVTELTCSYCLKVFSNKRGLRIHIRQHTGDGMRYCPLCSSKYTRTNHLVRHMKKHDKSGHKKKCKICSEKFSITMDLFNHMKMHIEEVEKKHKIDLDRDIILEIKSEKYETVSNDQNNLDGDTPCEQNEFTEEVITKEDGDIFEQKAITKDDDSADLLPLSQFPFSDDDVDRDNNDVENYSSESKNDCFAEQPKRKRGRPRKKEPTTLYECKECSKVLTTYYGLRVHMRKHTGAELASCNVDHCDKSFTKKSHLNRHLRAHGIFNGKNKLKGEKKVRECEFCDRKFKYRKSYVHHMQAEHGMSDIEFELEKDNLGNTTSQSNVKSEEANDENNCQTNDENCQANGEEQPLDENLPKLDGLEEFDVTVIDEIDGTSKNKVHVCHVCEAQFARANHLTRHMTLHRSVLTHKCDRCDQAFFTEDLLKQHIEQQHINKPYVCTTCNKPFSRGEHLIRHLKLHEALTDEGQHKCSICETLFARSDLLARHTKTHLMQDKRHVCMECGKAFNRLDNLKTHQRIHTGLKDNSKLHLCVYCGKEFNNSSNMIVHMRRHTGERPYKCNVCGKGFPRSHDLKCHERTHSGEKPYLCTLCGKSFNKSNKLLRHSRVHTGERPYVCNICGRAFTQSNDLALHMRRHTGARPYACGVCPARFIQSGQLKNHRRATGHWMETLPDLKGGHRVEPVTTTVEPMPIKFKTFGKNRAVKLEDEAVQVQHLLQTQEIEQRVDAQSQLSQLQSQPQRILMGIMGDIKIQSEVQPLIIDCNKLVQIPGSALSLVTLQGANGEEIKLKTEIGSFNLGQVNDGLDKHKVVTTSDTFDEGDAAVAFSTVQSSTTYTSAESFAYQTFNNI